MRHIDYYISSQLSETEENAQRHYTEKLITLDCPPQCFDFATEEQILATKNICRESLGINENTIVYVSGANYYKIIPEQEVTWAKIIANVPNSVLLLYPFNPNWSSSYPCTAFRKRIVNTFAKHGLSEDRLLILEPAPNRADVKERLKISDIYLDSYPYSGMTSLIDPLEVALPTVVMETETSRSRKGASLLQELGIYDLITNNEEDYIKLAIALGNNPELRQQKSAQIKEKMQGNPIFLNSRSYSAKIGSLFQEISSNYITDTLNQNFRLGDINLIIFPDWSQSEESVISELEQVIKTIATYPNSKKITLIININNFTLEYVELLLSSVTINLLMQEDLDITEGLDFFLVENLNYIQWQTILPHIYARIILDHEDKQTLTQVPVNKLLSCQLDNLNNQLYTISKQGNQMRDKIFKNLITYNIKQIPISLPCDHPLPYYQSRFRLYDKFISVVAKYLPNSQDFIIDIGANIGDTTALMLQYCSNPILCVEADKEFFSIMEHNLSKYRHRTVLVNSFVSGNDYKNVELVKSKGTVRAIESENNIVKSDSLKSIINNNNLDRCIFLKTDTDGFDFEILLSSIDVIKEHSPILYWENEISSLKDTEIAKNLLEQLSTINYEKYIVMDNFGNPLFYGGSSFNVEQINQYLLNNIYTQNNTFYYTDIVAFPSKYSYLISHIMSEYNHFIKNYEVYP
ncbi:FkbM family methyltransferase [Halotia branconii CENA392]|uniref:FkbM family methyltransferase n=2 Tax=Halotia TaxID=1620790 RepID=A0AAJ6NY63_9CYAN|nr:FkbM family methyltransferase [Halotia branconii]WGV28918.1 FkbM family methyltransferase [Halotia branconii CENA392]